MTLPFPLKYLTGLAICCLLMISVSVCSDSVTDTNNTSPTPTGNGEHGYTGIDEYQLLNRGTGDYELRLLPENNRYFEYKGLPMALYGSQGVAGEGRGVISGPEGLNEERIKRIAEHANHAYVVTALPYGANRETGFNGLYNKIIGPYDQGGWAHLTDVARWAYENDVVLNLYVWSYLWNYRGQSWTGSDMVYPIESSVWDRITTNNVTHLDLHEIAIHRLVGATWGFPNVVYNFMWEYNTRQPQQDPDGTFHRWWVDRMKEQGSNFVPDASHLFSIKFGSEHPNDFNADYIVDEDGNGFFYYHPHTVAQEHGVPTVFTSSDYVFADNIFTGWDELPYNPREWPRGQNHVHNITPEDVRAMATEGFHPAETWNNAEPEALKYYLQARWFTENIRDWSNEPGDQISQANFPDSTPSERPKLTNPESYTNGRSGDTYAAIYQHPEGLPPAQAEVWIDVNGDGRFDPDPKNGERFEMQAQGSDYAAGVLYTIEAPGVGSAKYVFRFADENWNPPARGGLVPGNAEGISYSHWK